ncbi:hypothetical protein KIN20_009933, partial [Parelaphostrongylus tenuis]
MGVSLYPCSLPGFGQTFKIPNDTMEIGLGIHGEPGFRREPMRSAQQIVDIMMTKLQAAVGFTKEQPIALILNNLGGVSQLELNIIKTEAIQWCQEASLAKKCVQAVCNKMTSMESELNALDGVAADGDCGSTFAHASKGDNRHLPN